MDDCLVWVFTTTITAKHAKMDEEKPLFSGNAIKPTKFYHQSITNTFIFNKKCDTKHVLNF